MLSLISFFLFFFFLFKLYLLKNLPNEGTEMAIVFLVVEYAACLHLPFCALSYLLYLIGLSIVSLGQRH